MKIESLIQKTLKCVRIDRYHNYVVSKLYIILMLKYNILPLTYCYKLCKFFYTLLMRQNHVYPQYFEICAIGSSELKLLEAYLVNLKTSLTLLIDWLLLRAVILL